MPYKYLGPASTFIYKDKEYHPGDSIPMTKDEMEHHAVWGSNHQFENSTTGTNTIDNPPHPGSAQTDTQQPANKEDK